MGIFFFKFVHNTMKSECSSTCALVADWGCCIYSHIEAIQHVLAKHKHILESTHVILSGCSDGFKALNIINTVQIDVVLLPACLQALRCALIVPLSWSVQWKHHKLVWFYARQCNNAGS